MAERVPDVRTALAAYLESLEVEGRSREAVRSRSYLLNPLRALKLSVHDFDDQLCRRLILDRRQAVQASSVRTFSQGLAAFLTFCVEQGWLPVHPMARIKRPRAPKKPHRYLSALQLRALYGACADDHERLAVLLMGGSGLRIGECSGLLWERVNVTDGSVEVLGKGDKWRAVDASHAMSILSRLPRRGKRVYRFGADALRVRLKRCGRAIGLSWSLRPHELRHSFAVAFLEASDEDGFTLQSVLGHADSEMTSHYVRSVRERAAVRKMKRVDLAGKLFGE